MGVVLVRVVVVSGVIKRIHWMGSFDKVFSGSLLAIATALAIAAALAVAALLLLLLLLALAVALAVAAAATTGTSDRTMCSRSSILHYGLHVSNLPRDFNLNRTDLPTFRTRLILGQPFLDRCSLEYVTAACHRGCDRLDRCQCDRTCLAFGFGTF